MIENWRPVIGHEGSYEVSDQGRVRSLDRTVVFKNGAKRFYKGQILKHGYSKGYPRVNLYKDTFPDFALIHQLVLAAFVGPMPFGMEVRHYDGNRENATLGNLLYGTNGDNYRDKIRHGRDNGGERSAWAKLKSEDIPVIRDLCASGCYTQQEIGDMYGVGQDEISRIKTFKRWKE